MGALSKYVDDLGPLARFYDFGIGETRIDAAEDIQDRNDATAWVAYSATALIEGWSSMSGKMRNDALSVLFDVLLRSLSGLADPMIAALSKGITEMAGSIPILAFIVEILKVVIGTFVDIAKGVHERNLISSRHYLGAVRRRFIETAFADPRTWVMETRPTPLRIKYLGYASNRTGPVAGKRFCKSPAWRPTRDQTLMFLKTAPRKPTGECKPRGKYYVSCPFHNRDLYGDDCWKSNSTKDSAKLCQSEFTMSCLFYPWWSPGYPVAPMQVSHLDSGRVYIDPNKLVMSRQFALLTDPDANLRVSGTRLRRITSTFIDWWMPRASGEMGLWPVDEEGNMESLDDDRDSLLIDAAFRKDWTGLVGEAGLYYTADGLIRSYDDTDLTKWGVHSRASLGLGADGGNLAVTAAQYNTVVSMTLAFFTARANMLRNGNLMMRMVGRGKVDEMDSGVRDAIRDAAEIGGSNIKLNVARFVGKSPTPGFALADFKGRLRKGLTLRDIKKRFRDPGLEGSSAGGGGALLLGVGVVGLLYALTRK